MAPELNSAIGVPQSIGRSVQSAIFGRGAFGHRPSVPVEPTLLARRARRRMSREGWAYLAGSAGHESTARANRRAFDRWDIVPRILRDVGRRDQSVELLGRRHPSPFVLSPLGVLDLMHPEADRAVSRAAAAEQVVPIFSNQASVTMEECAAAMDTVGDDPAPRWFQLYWSADDDLVASLVRRAEAIGCEAIVVTLDTHVLGWRPRDLDLGYLPFARGRGIAQYTSDPVFRRLVEQRLREAPEVAAPRAAVTPAAIRTLIEISRNAPGSFWHNLTSPSARESVQTFLDVFSRSTLTWEDLAFLRDITDLPIILKGVLSPDDARLAVTHGVDAIMVSNHGGRQVDGAIAALDALTAVVAEVDDQLPVLFDSGIRTGADAFKALALGATAVGIGRPYAYGLAVDGESGVRSVINYFRAELDLIMALAGRPTLADVTADTLTPHVP